MVSLMYMLMVSGVVKASKSPSDHREQYYHNAIEKAWRIDSEYSGGE
jgi:hypothetical protein